MKDRVREITSRNGGRSHDSRWSQELRGYLVGLEGLLPAGRDAGHLPRPRRVDPPPAARGAAQTVEARNDRLPRAARPGRPRDASPRQAAANYADAGGATAAHERCNIALPTSYFDRLGVPRLAALTSTYRTAGCGPACPVVWEGSSGTNPLPPIPIVAKMWPKNGLTRFEMPWYMLRELSPR